jgi:hypothetical protein
LIIVGRFLISKEKFKIWQWARAMQKHVDTLFPLLCRRTLWPLSSPVREHIRILDQHQTHLSRKDIDQSGKWIRKTHSLFDVQTLEQLFHARARSSLLDQFIFDLCYLEEWHIRVYKAKSIVTFKCIHDIKKISNSKTATACVEPSQVRTSYFHSSSQWTFFVDDAGCSSSAVPWSDVPTWLKQSPSSSLSVP